MPYTVKEKLQQLIDTPRGVPFPPFMQEYLKDCMNQWDEPLREMAREALDEIKEGWKEATIAWAVCASLHREYCKGKDPFFKTRQVDFIKHEEQSRAKITEK